MLQMQGGNDVDYPAVISTFCQRSRCTVIRRPAGRLGADRGMRSFDNNAINSTYYIEHHLKPSRIQNIFIMEIDMAAKARQEKNIKSSKEQEAVPPPTRMSTVIKEALDRIYQNIDTLGASSEHWKKIRKVLSDEDKDKILETAFEHYYNAEEMKPFQAELIKLQRHLERTGKKIIILFDGRDASGKGGTIRRITRYMNEKHYRVVAMGKPSESQRTELHMKRYIEQFPRSGEIVLFDRSWYNRALVEPVMGFCTQEQYKRFMKKVASYERNFIDDKKTFLLKLYFSVSKEEQAKRFERRKNDPLRQWKLSEVDLQAQDLWDDFTKMKYRLLKKTHTNDSKWFVVKSDDKHQARLQTMKLILSAIKYIGRRRTLDFTPDPKIIIPGNKELEIMNKERKTYGKFIS
ncbi:thymidylate kinase [bacterium BMS3Abin13]|nr:thymidylate kinase [bacterium BMS3Abin13]